ncbi:MAG: PASTA domain-containing protein [Firmicutes bacterium]|nr:PASTA domain-containing protein [Bacillota bacterium]
MKHVYKLDDGGQKFLYIVPETETEERFIIWFGFTYGMMKFRINGKDSLRFPAINDPEQTINNLLNAMDNYCERYGLVEIPNVTGLPLAEAKLLLDEQDLKWAVQKEAYSRTHPKGYVTFQSPRPGTSSKPDSIVYLDLSKGSD